MLHFCGDTRFNRLRPKCYNNVLVPTTTSTSGDKCLPPISNSGEMKEVRRMRDDRRNCISARGAGPREEIQPISKKGDNALTSKYDDSMSPLEKSAPLKRMSTRLKFLLPENIADYQRYDPEWIRRITPSVKIHTTSEKKVLCQRVMVPTNIHAPSLRLTKPQLIIPAVTCNATRKKVQEDCLNECEEISHKAKPKSDLNIENETCTQIHRTGDVPFERAPENEQSEDTQTMLTSWLDAKTTLPQTKPATLSSITKKSETNKSVVTQIDNNKLHPKDLLTVNNLYSRKHHQTTCNHIIDSSKEKVKLQTRTRPKTTKLSFEGNKISISEETSVKKLIEAVSFHRWKNRLESCESDCQLLADCVLAPMGSFLVESLDEATKKHRRHHCEIKAPVDCISLLLENCNKRRLKTPSSLTAFKRNPKRNTRVIKRDKTVKRKNKKDKGKMNWKSA